MSHAIFIAIMLLVMFDFPAHAATPAGSVGWRLILIPITTFGLAWVVRQGFRRIAPRAKVR